MSLNQDPSKQDQQFIFSSKVLKAVCPPLLLNITEVSETSQKYIGVILNEHLTLRALSI